MRLLNINPNRRTTKVRELDHYKMRNGGILALEEHNDGLKWVVAFYNRSDIMEWGQEFESLSAARNQFEYRKRSDKGSPDERGRKKAVDPSSGAKR